MIKKRNKLYKNLVFYINKKTYFLTECTMTYLLYNYMKSSL